MKCIFQRYWHVAADRTSDSLVTVRVSYCDTDHELAAQIVVNIKDSIIKEAVLEEHRAPRGIQKEVRKIQGLRGTAACVGNGPELHEGLMEVKNSLPVSLFLEAVRGFIQSGTFLSREKGFGSLQEYAAHWKKFYAGSCRYYSNIHRAGGCWSEYVGRSERDGVLFNRFKSQHVYEFKPGVFFIAGNLNDTFHEMSLGLNIEANAGRVLAAEAQMLRVPDIICRESIEYLTELEGAYLEKLSKKDLAGLMGRDQGCVHLIDTAYDSAMTLMLCKDENGGRL
ncbi:MAG: DUF2889 domain-containing protein [Clostridiales bacterium]|nr:DUF2889 domain-containing protein [Clostridiales bacterium]MCF8022920.1 DUF2889 domain-containing protein [Clostridiales bacterium]